MQTFSKQFQITGLIFFLMLLFLLSPFKVSAQTTLDSQELRDLKAQIYQAAQELGSYSQLLHQQNKGEVLGEVRRADSIPPFTRDLREGSRGEDVRDLQIFLNDSGYQLTQDPRLAGYPGDETDYFGDLTRLALTFYQQDRDISPAVGFFGSNTREQINQEISSSAPESLSSEDTQDSELDPEPTSFSLSVNLSGSGEGVVISSPTGIVCGGEAISCQERYEEGVSITLTATPDQNSSFQGWGGDCQGVGVCQLELNSDKSVVANFHQETGTNALSWPKDDAEKDPFYGYSWNIGQTDYDLDNPNLSYLLRYYSINHTPMNQVLGDPEHPVLEEMISFMDETMPEGHKVAFPWILDRRINNCSFLDGQDGLPSGPAGICPDPEPIDACLYPDDKIHHENYDAEKFNCIWWDNGVDWMGNNFDQFFEAFKNAGGEMDVFVMDFESVLRYSTIRNTGLTDDFGNHIVDPEYLAYIRDLRWQAIENDPRYTEENIAGLLEEKGYDFSEGSLSETIDLGDNNEVWNAVMEPRVIDYLNEAFYDGPIQNHFPDALVSNYNHHFKDPELGFPVKNGSMIVGSMFEGDIVGTHQSRSFYASNFNSLYEPRTGLPGQNTPFNVFRYEVNKARLLYLSNNDSLIHPWIPWMGWPSQIQNTHFYQEMLFHLGMTNTDQFLYFAPSAAGTANHYVLQETLEELNEVLGYSGRRNPKVTELTDWFGDYIYSGVNIGDKNIWRFTPKLQEGQTKESVLLSPGNINSQEGVVFKVGDETVTFFNAVVYNTGFDFSENVASFLEGESVSTQGFWVIQDADAPEISVTNIDFNFPEDGMAYGFPVDEIIYELSGTHQFTECWHSAGRGQGRTSTTCGEPITNLSFTEGENHLTIGTKDMHGAEGSKTISFYIDFNDPNISFIPPTPGDGWSMESPMTINVSSRDESEHYTMLDFDNSLSGWWRFEEDTWSGSSGEVLDWSGNQNQGVALGNSTTDIKGKFGRSAKFDGEIGSYIQIDDFSGEGLGQSGVTFSAWFKLGSINYFNAGPGVLGITSGGNSFWYSTGGLAFSNGEIIMMARDSSGSNVSIRQHGFIPKVGDWHHAVGVYDPETAQIRLYVDGELIGVESIDGIYEQGSFARIGRTTRNEENHHLDGMVDEAMIFNRALSENEIKTLFNAEADQYFQEFSGLDSGTYNFKAYAVDLAGNFKETEERTVQISGGF